MLTSADDWIWDSWLADTGAEHHLFFLHAPRSLGDPDLRHVHARVGHAVSRDLRTWRRVDDALSVGDAAAFDAGSTWTGSVVRGDDGRWVTLYTGARLVDVPGPGGGVVRGVAQQIGRAVCDDPGLLRWRKDERNPLLLPDPTWYERFGDSSWHGDAWRDPWVLRDPGGDGWHALITARAKDGPVDERGVIGHATSPDLATWTAQPPLSAPGSGFGHLEVPQVERVDGRWVLLFNCLRADLSAAHRERRAGTTGVWAVEAPGPLGPFDVAAAQPLTDEGLYVGRLVRERSGRWVLLAFENTRDGAFGGAITDPLPVRWSGDRLVLEGPGAA